jgi:hypothetical protein
MNAPARWRDSVVPAARLLRDASRVAPTEPAARAALWRRLETAADPARPRVVPAVAHFVAVAAATAAVVLVVTRVMSSGGEVAAPTPAPAPPPAAAPAADAPPAPTPEPAGPQVVNFDGEGVIEVWQGAALRVPPAPPAPSAERRVALDAGKVRVRVAPRSASRPFVVVTPHLRAVVVGTRFTVAVAGDASTVAVEEGKVRVEGPGGAVLLAAGEVIGSDDARLRRTAVAREVECPASGPTSDRRACLEAQARGKGLRAENALLALGLLERDVANDRARAVAAWRAHQRRFPRGVLAAEVTVSLAQTLQAAGRPAEAAAVAEGYRARFPADTRTGAALRRVTGEGRETTGR